MFLRPSARLPAIHPRLPGPCHAGAVDDQDRRERFDAVVRECVEPLRRFLVRRTDAATADDVLGDTLLVAWRRFEDLPEQPLPYLYGVARNCLANAERAVRRRDRLTARLAEQRPGPPPGGGAVAEAMDRLKPEDAELLRLWAWEQLTPPEVATVLGISVNAASIRLTRARQKLREELRKIGLPGGHEGLGEGGSRVRR